MFPEGFKRIEFFDNRLTLISKWFDHQIWNSELETGIDILEYLTDKFYTKLLIFYWTSEIINELEILKTHL